MPNCRHGRRARESPPQLRHGRTRWPLVCFGGREKATDLTASPIVPQPHLCHLALMGFEVQAPSGGSALPGPQGGGSPLWGGPEDARRRMALSHRFSPSEILSHEELTVGLFVFPPSPPSLALKMWLDLNLQHCVVQAQGFRTCVCTEAGTCGARGGLLPRHSRYNHAFLCFQRWRGAWCRERPPRGVWLMPPPFPSPTK